MSFKAGVFHLLATSAPYHPDLAWSPTIYFLWIFKVIVWDVVNYIFFLSRILWDQ